MKLDPEAIREINEYAAGYDPDIFNEIMVEYISNSASLVGQLDDAFQQQNSVLLERTAHTLKGQGGAVGALAFSVLCGELELMAKSGNLTAVLELINKVKREYSEVKAALRFEIEQNYNIHGSK